MTREEKINKMKELRDLVEKNVIAYNEAKQGEGTFAEITKMDEEITQHVNEYAGIARSICFEDCAASENPMLEAALRLNYTTIGVKDEKKGDMKIAVRKVIEKERQIDILKLHKFVKDGIGKNKDWPYMIEKLNLLMTCETARELKIDPTTISNSYAISEIAKGYDLGKNPTSKTNLLKTLTAIVQAMLGDEYKPLSHDVNFLLKVYSRKSREALTVACANHRYMRGYLLEICHRIVSNNPYGIACKKKREA